MEVQRVLRPVDEPLVVHGLGDDPPADPVHVLLREHPIKRHGRPPSREGAGLPCARNRCALVRPHLVPFHPASALFHPTTCRAAPMSPSPGRSRPAHRANTRLHHICRGDVARGSGAAPSRVHQDVPSVNASPSSTIRIFILWRRTVAGSSHEYREHPSPVPWRCTPRRPGGGVLSPSYHTRTPRGTSPCLRRRTFRLPVAPTRANVDGRRLPAAATTRRNRVHDPARNRLDRHPRYPQRGTATAHLRPPGADSGGPHRRLPPGLPGGGSSGPTAPPAAGPPISPPSSAATRGPPP